MKHNEVAGQMLLEVILAIAMAIITVGAVMMIIVASLSRAQYSKNQDLANSYAREGIDTVRKMRDSNWSDFHSKNGSYCLNQGAVALGSPPCTANVGGIFTRKVNLLQDDSVGCSGGGALSGAKITVTVSWPDNKCPPSKLDCNNVTLVSCFSNINAMQAP
jgi:type II secretory pathway pseudopilin PulG